MSSFISNYRPQAWRSTWRRSTTGVETSPASTATRVLPKATHSRSTSWQSTPTTSATPGTNTGKNFIYYILLPHWTKARLYLSKVCFVINDFQLLVNGKAHSCTHLRKSLQNGSSKEWVAFVCLTKYQHFQFVLSQVFRAQNERVQTRPDGAQEQHRWAGFRGKHPQEVRHFFRSRCQAWTFGLTGSKTTRFTGSNQLKHNFSTIEGRLTSSIKTGRINLKLVNYLKSDLKTIEYGSKLVKTCTDQLKTHSFQLKLNFYRLWAV